VTDLSDFDRYCDEHKITDEETPMAFAAWLHERTGGKWDGDAGPIEEEG
jgi:hypothetical protein